MDENKRRMLEQVLGGRGGSGQGADPVKEKDARVRQAVADLYLVLTEVKNPDLAINMLAEHVAIMVDMINEFKNTKR
jgi:hypothetical protein